MRFTNTIATLIAISASSALAAPTSTMNDMIDVTCNVDEIAPAAQAMNMPCFRRCMDVESCRCRPGMAMMDIQAW